MMVVVVVVVVDVYTIIIPGLEACPACLPITARSANLGKSNLALQTRPDSKAKLQESGFKRLRESDEEEMRSL